MKLRSIGIVVFVVLFAGVVWAGEKVEPTKEQLAAEYGQINLQYQLNQERSKVIAYENRDLLKRAQEIQAAIKKLDEAEKAKDKKEEKK